MKSVYSNPIFLPLTLIFVGVLALMVKTGVLPADIVNLWPVIPVLIGLIGLSNLADSSAMSSSGGKRSSKSRK